MTAATLTGFSLLIVDDHPLFREGISLAIAARVPGIDVAAVATPAQAEVLLGDEPDRFDLIIADYRLAGGENGLDWARRLRGSHPALACALMSGEIDTGLAEDARAAMLAAFLPKSLDVDTLLDALTTIARGDRWFPAAAHTGAGSALTARQREIVSLAARGASSKEIARRLGISPTTVRNHFCQIFERLGARNRAQAVALARQAIGGNGSLDDQAISDW